MSRFELQEALWAMPAYRTLNPKRRKAATAHLIEGLSFFQACRRNGLNQSRERVSALAVCIKAFEQLHGPRTAGTDRPLTIYERAALLERQLEAEKPRDTDVSLRSRAILETPDPAKPQDPLAEPAEALEDAINPVVCIVCGTSADVDAASRLCIGCDPEARRSPLLEDPTWQRKAQFDGVNRSGPMHLVRSVDAGRLDPDLPQLCGGPRMNDAGEREVQELLERLRRHRENPPPEPREEFHPVPDWDWSRSKPPATLDPLAERIDEELWRRSNENHHEPQPLD